MNENIIENDSDLKLDNQNSSKLDNKGRAYATGKRKNSTARVWLKRGKGDIVINGKKIDKYFVRPVLIMMINHPFEIVNLENNFDVFITVFNKRL